MEKTRTIFMFVGNNRVEHYGSLARLAIYHPEVSYYKAYRTLRKEDVYSTEDFTISKESLILK